MGGWRDLGMGDGEIEGLGMRGWREERMREGGSEDGRMDGQTDGWKGTLPT